MNTDAAKSLPIATEELRPLTAKEIGSVAGSGWMASGQPYVYTHALTQTSSNAAAEALGLVAGGAAVAFSSASSSTGGTALGSAIAAIFL